MNYILMILKFSLVLVTLSQTAKSQSVSPEEMICREAFKEASIQKKKKPKIKLAHIWSVYFKPAKMVSINLQESKSTTSEKTDTNRIAFINLQDESFTKIDRQEEKEIKSQQKEFKRIIESINLKGIIKSSGSEVSCVNSLKASPVIQKYLQDIEVLAQKKTNLIAKKRRYNEYKMFLKYENYLTNQGWVIHKNENMNEISQIIKSWGRSSVLFIGHATAEGVLIDSEGNSFPSTFFKNLGNYLNNLILYNCSTIETAKFYSLSSVKTLVHLSQPSALFSEMLDQKVPIRALRSLSNVSLLKSIESNVNECSIMTDRILDSSLKANVGVYINQVFIGPLGPKNDFDCSLLKNLNTVEIYSNTKKTYIGALGLGILSLVTPEGVSTIPLKEVISGLTKNHIVTKGNF